MLLVTVLTLGVAGALGTTVARLVVKDRVSRRRAYYLIFGLSFLLVLGSMNKFVTPELYRYLGAEELVTGLQKNPAFVAMRQYDRPLYDQMVAEATAAVRGGMNVDQVQALMRDKGAAVVQHRIGKARDETITGFVAVSQKQLKFLHRRGGGACYAYMFPQPGQSLGEAKTIDRSLIQEELTMTGEIIKDSTTSPQQVPTAEEIQPQFQAVARALTLRYSPDDLQLLQQPQRPGWDKEKVCELHIALYDEIMALPMKQRAPLLRYMLGGSSSSL